MAAPRAAFPRTGRLQSASYGIHRHAVPRIPAHPFHEIEATPFRIPAKFESPVFPFVSVSCSNLSMRITVPSACAQPSGVDTAVAVRGRQEGWPTRLPFLDPDD